MRPSGAGFKGFFLLGSVLSYGALVAASACSDGESGRDFGGLGSAGGQAGEGSESDVTAGQGGSGEPADGTGGAPTPTGDECAVDDECQDALACNGDEQCDNGYCVAGHSPCSNPDQEHCTEACTEGEAGPICGAMPADADGDGHGDHLCSAAEIAGDDCDDGDETIFAGAEELCDGKDNDCDEDADENTPRWYLDCDGDGFAATTDGSVVTCKPPAPDACGGGWTSVRPLDNSNTDCLDSNDSVHPKSDIDYQEDPIPNTTSFDWNCDGKETHHYGGGLAYSQNVSGECSKLDISPAPYGFVCAGATGWTGNFPECGVTAGWSACEPYHPTTNNDCAKRETTENTEICK